MRNALFLTVALFALSVPAQAEDKKDDVPSNIQQKYDRRLEEMKALDKNKDGVLQAEELGKSVDKKFDAADTNKDGILSPEETAASLERFKVQGQQTYGNTTDKRAKRLENRYQNADANEDGKISEQEYNAYFGGRYQKFDRDGDGVISEKEYRSDSEKMPRSYSKEND
ncbi:MAG: EF-hand domain-containing protein [Alphaproteobacteria bacterium]